MVTRNDGKDWTDVTNNIPGHPGYWVSRVEPSHFDSGTAYVTITGYRNDDFKPFIWKTTDYGKSWESLASGLPDEPICVDPRALQNSRSTFYRNHEAGARIL